MISNLGCLTNLPTLQGPYHTSSQQRLIQRIVPTVLTQKRIIKFESAKIDQVLIKGSSRTSRSGCLQVRILHLRTLLQLVSHQSAVSQTYLENSKKFRARSLSISASSIISRRSWSEKFSPDVKADYLLAWTLPSGSQKWCSSIRLCPVYWTVVEAHLLNFAPSVLEGS